MPYVAHTPEERQAMLDVIGVKSVEDLFTDIEPGLKPRSFNIPAGLSEMAVRRKMEAMAAKNNVQAVSFLGAGFYDHYIPAAVDALSGRGEFYTAYTPYQPEASQGTLQAIFEYQTAACALLDMDAANASVYDGGTAVYEAIMMAVRHTKRRKILICETLNPIYRVMLSSYTANLNLELVTVPHREGSSDFERIKAALCPQTAALIVQNPNFFGNASDYTDIFAKAEKNGTVTIASVYPLMQAVLKTPGEMGADIAVAEGQSLGLPLSFGGPYLGIMACKKKVIRQMPGRIVGRTVDNRGNTAYVLTLQAREQHIRRAKATSNICSNQALCALRSLIYICLEGPEGLRRTALLSIERAHYAAKRLAEIPGVSIYNSGNFCNEFTVALPVNAYTVIDKLMDRGYIPGFPLGRYYSGLENHLLVACTEKTAREDIGILAEMIGGLL